MVIFEITHKINFKNSQKLDFTVGAMAEDCKKGLIFEIILYTGYALSGGMHTTNSSRKHSFHVVIFEFASRKRDMAVSSIAPLQLHTKQPYKINIRKYTNIEHPISGHVDLQGKPTVGEVWGCGTTPTATIFALEANGVVHIGELLEPAQSLHNTG